MDFGAGTGALLATLKAHCLDAVGLEPSAAMIEQGPVLHPELEATDFEHGDAGAMTSEDGMFDLIVSRQVICHFDQPDRDFRRMLGLLKPKGTLMLVDGFWPATSWSPEQLAALPFAALITADPVAELLRNVGFAIEQAEPFLALNEARRAAFPASKDRYIVIARRN
ncbi:methyltransferase domain-containing protein (plasmid) [Devosia sp. A8/3-2]|nr:methyltransferase domain-containing protein [Devosia sp. A8/3-2]